MSHRISFWTYPANHKTTQVPYFDDYNDYHLSLYLKRSLIVQYEQLLNGLWYIANTRVTSGMCI